MSISDEKNVFPSSMQQPVHTQVHSKQETDDCNGVMVLVSVDSDVFHGVLQLAV